MKDIITMFESRISYSFLAWFKELKSGKKIVYLRPSITMIDSEDKTLLEFIKYINLDNVNVLNQVTDTKKSYNYKRICIQNMDNAKIIIEAYENHKFLDARDKLAYDRFVMCYDHVRDIGTRHDEYDSGLMRFVQLKEVINRKPDIPKAKELLNKIKDHLN